MKVLLVNGSPHKKGCTYQALQIISETLLKEGIEAEIFQIEGNVQPCQACYACKKLGHCVQEDAVNSFVDKMAQADGLILGSPVHYASCSGLLTSFMDRAFFVGSVRNVFAHKPGVSVVSARRAGTTAALDQLNKYFSISQMPIISGRYWNMVHGNTPDEVLQDKEGCQNLKILARNFAWHLKCQACAKEQGLMPPKMEPVEMTNFIR